VTQATISAAAPRRSLIPHSRLTITGCTLNDRSLASPVARPGGRGVGRGTPRCPHTRKFWPPWSGTCRPGEGEARRLSSEGGGLLGLVGSWQLLVRLRKRDYGTVFLVAD
jgi:hypothetical protein